MLRLALACSLVSVACGRAPAEPARAVAFMHTLSPPESAQLDELIAERELRVDATLLPFSRGEAVVRTALTRGERCPDLIRIDATWLPGLVALLAPPPPALRDRGWLAPAQALASIDGALAAAPMSLDGLVVVRREGAPPPTPWPARDLTGLEAAARAGTGPGRFGLGLRVDGYWLVPFLRAHGADVADGTTGGLGIDGPEAEAALTEFAALFRDGVAAPPPPLGAEAPREAAQFRAGAIALLITGPWAFGSLGQLDGDLLGGLTVDALPGAPLGAQLLAVPRCATDPTGGWALADALTQPAIAGAWARRLGTVPASRDGLAAASPLAQAAYAALAEARPLPRHPLSTALFDDLTPAVAAVVAGDATAAEAIAGVRRAWARALRTAPREAAP